MPGTRTGDEKYITISSLDRKLGDFEAKFSVNDAINFFVRG